MFKKLIRRDHHISHRIASSSRRPQKLFVVISLLAIPEITFSLSGLYIIVGVATTNLSLRDAGLFALGTLCVGSITKLLVRRVRPDTTYVQSMRTHTFSFPSGHSTGSMVVYGSFAWVIASELPLLLGTLTLLTAGVYIFLVGVSRVYLGAHYVSDVIAGWLLGAAGLLLYILSGN